MEDLFRYCIKWRISLHIPPLGTHRLQAQHQETNPASILCNNSDIGAKSLRGANYKKSIISDQTLRNIVFVFAVISGELNAGNQSLWQRTRLIGVIRNQHNAACRLSFFYTMFGYQIMEETGQTNLPFQPLPIRNKITDQTS